MKKYLILIPVAILALWAGITWIIGSQTQSGFTSVLEKLNDNLGSSKNVTAVAGESYSRGFLSSEAITKITVAGKVDEEEKDLFLKFKAWHGPLMMTPDGMKIGAEYVIVTLDKERLPAEIRKIVDEGFKAEEPIEMSFFTGFGGKLELAANIAAFTSKDGDPITLKFEGFSGELQTNINNTFAKGKMNIGELKIEDKKKGKLFSMATSAGEMDYKDVVVRVAGDGKSHIDFPEIKVVDNGSSYTLTDLHFDNISKQSKGKLDTNSKMSIGGFKGPNKGPYAEMINKMDGKFEIEFSAEGMDTETLQLMATAQRKMQRTQAGKGENSKTPEQARHDYMIAASSLLQPGYKMKSHIAFANDKGKSEIGLGIEYTGEKPLFELGTIRDLLQALEVALNLQINKDLIPAAASKQIEPAIGMGFILDQGAAYKGDAILGGGNVTVNGKESPVLKNMGPMLDMPIPWEKLGVTGVK